MTHPKRLRRLSKIGPEHTQYFLAICTLNRQSVLANAQVNERIRLFISDSLDRYGVWVNCYLVMPAHIHLIVSVARESNTLGEWVKAFKAVVAHREFRWQAGCFDHVLRSEESTSEKWEYIRMNPVRAGLVAKPEEWTFSAFYDSRTGLEL